MYSKTRSLLKHDAKNKDFLLIVLSELSNFQKPISGGNLPFMITTWSCAVQKAFKQICNKQMLQEAKAFSRIKLF